jgi:hypothetical protein
LIFLASEFTLGGDWEVNISVARRGNQMMKMIDMQPPMSLLNVSYASVQIADAAGWDENCEDVDPRLCVLASFTSTVVCPPALQAGELLTCPPCFPQMRNTIVTDTAEEAMLDRVQRRSK